MDIKDHTPLQTGQTFNTSSVFFGVFFFLALGIALDFPRFYFPHLLCHNKYGLCNEYRIRTFYSLLMDTLQTFQKHLIIHYDFIFLPICSIYQYIRVSELKVLRFRLSSFCLTFNFYFFMSYHKINI